MIPAAAFLLRLDPKGSLFILLRDRFRHASPNSGHTEAAVAGALGVQLGGANRYFGKMVDKPFIGEAIRPIEPRDILRTNRLMLLASAITLLAFLALRHQCLALQRYFIP